MRRWLRVGGLVAVGLDATGEHLLVITHSGRGVFSTRSWQPIARDAEPAYPEGGLGIGIGPIEGQSIPVTEIDYAIGSMRVEDPRGRFVLECESDQIAAIDLVTPERPPP